MQELKHANTAAAAAAEVGREAQALRQLYNEELSRASKLAVELSRTTAAVDRAATAEDGWRRALAKSDSRAGHAEGLAGAASLAAKQLEDQLAAERSAHEAQTRKPLTKHLDSSSCHTCLCAHMHTYTHMYTHIHTHVQTHAQLLPTPIKLL